MQRTNIFGKCNQLDGGWTRWKNWRGNQAQKGNLSCRGMKIVCHAKESALDTSNRMSFSVFLSFRKEIEGHCREWTGGRTARYTPFRRMLTSFIHSTKMHLLHTCQGVGIKLGSGDKEIKTWSSTQGAHYLVGVKREEERSLINNAIKISCGMCFNKC